MTSGSGTRERDQQGEGEGVFFFFTNYSGIDLLHFKVLSSGPLGGTRLRLAFEFGCIIFLPVCCSRRSEFRAYPNFSWRRRRTEAKIRVFPDLNSGQQLSWHDDHQQGKQGLEGHRYPHRIHPCARWGSSHSELEQEHPTLRETVLN
nr:uncharacterized protein LOC111846594 isoform X2 [Paramormyrops kingsleyae]